MMQLVSGANTPVVTVQENVTIANPEFLFIFINDHSYKKVACTSTETELDHGRSSFTITVQANPTPLSGEIELDLLGSYHYYIYEKTAAQIAAFDYANVDTVDIRTITGLVESGKMEYRETASTPTYYKDVRTSTQVYGS